MLTVEYELDIRGNRHAHIRGRLVPSAWRELKRFIEFERLTRRDPVWASVDERDKHLARICEALGAGEGQDRRRAGDRRRVPAGGAVLLDPGRPIRAEGELMALPGDSDGR